MGNKPITIKTDAHELEEVVSSGAFQGEKYLLGGMINA